MTPKLQQIRLIRVFLGALHHDCKIRIAAIQFLGKFQR